VCFGPKSLGSGPLNALYQMSEPIDWEAARLTTNSTALCDGVVFRVGERFTFSLAGAETWCPAMLATPWQPAIMIRNLAMLAREAATRPARGGLQPLIPILAETVEGFAWTGCDASPLVRVALPGIASLADWLETSLACPKEPVPVPIPAFEVLIGLGPGLTPSGDDFLGGVLVGLRQLGAPDLASRLATAVLSRAEQRTHEISRAHLAAAAGGEGLAPLHLMLSSLCTPGAFDIGECLSLIDAIGHTSGWDALAGVALAAAIMARIPTVRREMWVSV
jgi:hypothetical protein